MCGLAGILLPKKLEPSLQNHYIQTLNKILTSQSYRGPDYQAAEIITSPNQSLYLGHNRLSIVDLNPTSNQPMWDEQKRFCIVYNGMVYNYREIRTQLKQLGYLFFSEGDTEVVLKAFLAWGVDAFSNFNGMFAIAIYDKQDEKLYLVRDRFGVKPLFYYVANNAVYFASTTNAMAKELNLLPNMDVIARGLHSWCYDNGSDTVYKNLFMVPPSEVITIHYNWGWKLAHKKYYELANKVSSLIEGQTHWDLNVAIEEANSLLSDSVAIRLRSDVPIAVSLSGGIDSNIIAALAKKKLGTVQAFTFGSLENQFSEAKLTDLAARKSGIELHFLNPTQEEMQSAFWEALTMQDAPFPNFSIAAQYLVFKNANKAGIKVMLGGQGGDEIFMGYRKYLIFYLQRLIHSRKYIAASSFFLNLLPVFIREMNNSRRMLFNLKRYKQKLDTSRWPSKTLNLSATPANPLWQRQLLDIEALSLPTLLRYEDRNSMGNSIESRLPFLDYRLVELALALPEQIKLHRGYSKWILRKMSAPHIPTQIAFTRVKRGFDVDNKTWVMSGIGESLRSTLNDNTLLLKKMGLENKIQDLFCDANLISNPFVLGECITLAWLARINWS